MLNYSPISTYTQSVYDKAFCEFLDQGMGLVEAEEAADAFLLEWSQPLELPDPPAGYWY